MKFKKYILPVLFFFVSFLPHLAHADVLIDEIAWMGTPESQYGEWIELYNSGSSDVSLSGWKLYEAGGTTLIFSLAKTISSNGYLIIERTTPSAPDPLPTINNEAGSFGGSGLSNAGEYLVLKNADGENVQSLDFSSGWPAGDAETKQTMQLVNGVWVTADGTPDSVNNGSPNVPDTNTNTSDGTENTQSSTVATSTESTTNVLVASPSIPKKITAHINVKTPVFAGIATPITFSVTGLSDEPLTTGRFMWNMGDGTFKNEVNSAEPFEYSYEYPGQYVIVLDYYRNQYVEPQTPDASARVVVTVVSSTIAISNVLPDGSVEISNTGGYEMDLSKWLLQSGDMSFAIHKNTIILPGKKIIFSSHITHFSPMVSGMSELLYPDGVIASVYPKQQSVPVVKKSVVVYAPAAAPITQTSVVANNSNNIQNQIETIPLAAAASMADPADDSDTRTNALWPVVFIAGVILAIGVAIYIRRSAATRSAEGQEAGHDIKILEP